MGATILPDLGAQIFIPLCAIIGILFSLVQWYYVSQVKLSSARDSANNNSSSAKNGYSDYLIEEEEGVNDHNVVIKCAEIQNAISEGIISFYSFLSDLFSLLFFLLLDLMPGFLDLFIFFSFCFYFCLFFSFFYCFRVYLYLLLVFLISGKIGYLQFGLRVFIVFTLLLCVVDVWILHWFFVCCLLVIMLRWNLRHAYPCLA